MSYEQSAREGHLLGTLRHGILTGTLWAIAISWSTSIRAITLAILPDDTTDQIMGELLSTVFVTVVGVGTALVVGRCTRRTERIASRLSVKPSLTRPGGSQSIQTPRNHVGSYRDQSQPARPR